MQTISPMLVGRYLRDLLAQPAAMADTLEALRSVELPTERLAGYTKVVMTGMGSSLHALHPSVIRLVRAGRLAVLIETSELVHSQGDLLDERTLLVVVSQSGQSAECVLLLERLRQQVRRPYVIGVTNTAESPLGAGADAVIPVRAGVEYSVSCKTYVATLVALEWLCDCLLGVGAGSEELELAGPAVAGYLDGVAGHVRELTESLAGLRHLFVVGRGTSLAAVGTGALIIKEATGFHAEGMSSSAFRHGPLEMVGPGLVAVVFAGTGATAGLNHRLACDIDEAGGRAMVVQGAGVAGDMVGDKAGDRAGAGGVAPRAFRLPEAPERLWPVLEILPVQMMTLALAGLAGRRPGVFERASKVTTVQ